MSLFIASLNSGSNGNCYYIGNEEEAVLVDAGLSCKETGIRLERIGLDIKKIKAIFISHEHSDHIHGVCVLARKYQLPVYITSGTLTYSQIPVSYHLIRSFQAYTPVEIGRLTITAFPKIHDAADPHSFVIACGSVKVGVFTDLGRVCEHVIENFKKCHAVFLESNYDEEMLEKGRYPYALKNRIRGGRGHISNKEALKLFEEHRPAYMTHLLLSHLSQDNNNPSLVEELFKTIAGRTEIVIASRHKETEVYQIKSYSDADPLPYPLAVSDYPSLFKPVKKVKKVKNEFQLSLF